MLKVAQVFKLSHISLSFHRQSLRVWKQGRVYVYDLWQSPSLFCKKIETSSDRTKRIF